MAPSPAYWKRMEPEFSIGVPSNSCPRRTRFPSRNSIPPASDRMTNPRKPASDTRMFAPFPSRKWGTPTSRAASMILASSSGVRARKKRSAGPPIRNVVNGANGTPDCIEPGPRRASSASFQFTLGSGMPIRSGGGVRSMGHHPGGWDPVFRRGAPGEAKVDRAEGKAGRAIPEGSDPSATRPCIRIPLPACLPYL